MAKIWNIFVQNCIDELDVSRTQAHLIVIAVFVFVGYVLVVNWFICCISMLIAIMLLTALLIVEYAFRVWYVLWDAVHPRAKPIPIAPSHQAVPDSLSVRCADSQGRIGTEEIWDHDFDDMAEKILQRASVQVPSIPPFCRTPFPAIARMFRSRQILAFPCTFFL